MSRYARTTGKGLLAAVVLAILAFGTQKAVASSLAMTCPDDNWNWVGWQPSYDDCWAACWSVHGSELQAVHWNSSTGCCTCLF